VKKLRAADLFCGAGGFTTGAQAAGVNVVLAVNHWRTAIQTHRENHPSVRHICARIDDVDPRNDKTLPTLDMIFASPECVHHSIARGGRPIDDQKRCTPWHVCVWAEAKRPRWVIVENVREFRDWGPLLANNRPDPNRKGETFRAWIPRSSRNGTRHGRPTRPLRN
jgi:DNA (cytosine-5)-methyltransferase 1